MNELNIYFQHNLQQIINIKLHFKFSLSAIKKILHYLKMLLLINLYLYFANSFAIMNSIKQKLMNIINLPSPRKAMWPNSIPTDILHMLNGDISIFPDLLKITKTITIYQKGSKLDISNYHHISLLSNINKFLEDKKCIYDLQFGFRKRHSTSQTLIEMTETYVNLL